MHSPYAYPSDDQGETLRKAPRWCPGTVNRSVLVAAKDLHGVRHHLHRVEVVAAAAVPITRRGLLWGTVGPGVVALGRRAWAAGSWAVPTLRITGRWTVTLRLGRARCGAIGWSRVSGDLIPRPGAGRGLAVGGSGIAGDLIPLPLGRTRAGRRPDRYSRGFGTRRRAPADHRPGQSNQAVGCRRAHRRHRPPGCRGWRRP